MQPAYYEDFKEIKKKIWSMLGDAVTNRSSQFRIPVFVCGDQKNFDGAAFEDLANTYFKLFPFSQINDSHEGFDMGCGSGRWAKFIAPKGSVALNGTSLTVNEVNGTHFGINFIPHTKAVTTWGSSTVGDRVNLEIDTLARYVARLQDWS